MIIKELRDEDFINYKKPSMFLAFPSCSFKCCKEGGFPVHICQNNTLATAPNIEVSINSLIERYMNNVITQAIVFGGMEPFDSWDDLQCFIMNFRYWSNDDIVIYTGYNKEEVQDKIEWLKLYGPVTVKFGRFVPNQESHYDAILGVKLASDNQYAEVIS